MDSDGTTGEAGRWHASYAEIGRGARHLPRQWTAARLTNSVTDGAGRPAIDGAVTGAGVPDVT